MAFRAGDRSGLHDCISPRFSAWKDVGVGACSAYHLRAGGPRALESTLCRIIHAPSGAVSVAVANGPHSDRHALGRRRLPEADVSAGEFDQSCDLIWCDERVRVQPTCTTDLVNCSKLAKRMHGRTDMGALSRMHTFT